MIVVPLFGCLILLLLIAIFVFTPLWPFLLVLILLTWLFGPRKVVIHKQIRRQKPSSPPPPPEPQTSDDVIDVVATEVTDAPSEKLSLEGNDHAR